MGDLFSKLLNIKVILSALKILLVYSIHFNNFPGMKTKCANVNHKV